MRLILRIRYQESTDSFQRGAPYPRRLLVSASVVVEMMRARLSQECDAVTAENILGRFRQFCRIARINDQVSQQNILQVVERLIGDRIVRPRANVGELRVEIGDCRAGVRNDLSNP